MEKEILITLSLVCLCVHGFPSEANFFTSNTNISRNTIFGDELLKGQIFEGVDVFSNVELTPRNTDTSPYRLPTTTKPVHYNVLWTIDFAQNPPRQSGTVQINLHATQANVNQIVIHCDQLNLTRVQLTQENLPIVTTYSEDSTYQRLIVRLLTGSLAYDSTNPIIYTLTIDFGAYIRDDMYGIYKNWFRNSATDDVRWMASTQFQPTAARWAFPCYDEPSFKATFDVTIRRQTAYQSWFCTRRSHTVQSVTGFEDDVYYTTPVMSTYLLAIIVAEYASLPGLTNTQGDVMYEVIARPGAINSGQGEYALTAGQALLAEMSDHTGYDFYSQHSALKMTQAAIPDFGAGAMENWGLLTYREAYLMYDESETNSNFKQIIAYILSHEITHMWYGNLVTCDWWDSVWLNEGFARYYQYFLTNAVEGMGFATRFIVEQMHTALLSDSSNNPQPLTNPGLSSNSAVRGMFSTISYNKGAGVIRMTEHLLGYDVNRQGLRNYLRGREFLTAVPLHLFEYLEAAGNASGVLNYGPDFSFIDYYKSWTEQRGHPVLNVHVNHQTGEMTIYQRRFNINTGYSTLGTNYIVPITFATASDPNFNNTKPTHIISQAISTINRGSIGDEWVIFNKQQTGFYRVNYDDYTWDLIALALRGTDRTRIHEYNRAQIVNDVFQFARSGLMTYSRALNILSFLENETEYAPWVAAMTGFSWLRNRLAAETTATQLTQLNARIAQWASTVMTSLTYNPIPGESFLRSYLRYQLAPVMCSIGVQACLDAARTQFQALRLSNTPVAVDSRNWVYCNALRQGGAVEFNFLWDRFQAHNVYTEKILILQNIGCTKDENSLRTLMTAVVTDNYIIRPQDYSTAFSGAVNGNEENTDIAFRFIQENMELVANGFSGSLATPLGYVSARLRSVASIEAFRTWATANQLELGTAYNSVINGAESSRQSIVWAESIQSDLNNYLQVGADPITTTTAAPETTVTVSTTQAPSITEPVTPNLPTTPSSAPTSVLGATMVLFAIITNALL